MGCAYSDEKLQEFDSVANPMGPACRDCTDCICEHWDGVCPCSLVDSEDCYDPDRVIEVALQEVP
jgi:hypothetical protein